MNELVQEVVNAGDPVNTQLGEKLIEASKGKEGNQAPEDSEEVKGNA